MTSWCGGLHHRLRRGRVTVAIEDVELLTVASEVFTQWQDSLTELFADAGMAPRDAKGFSCALLSAVEGAVVISRAQRNLHTLNSTPRQFERLLAGQQNVNAA